MKTAMKKISRSYDQQKLKVLSDHLCNNIEKVLDSLNIQEYKIFDKMIAMKCPIHNGDNASACNLYYVGDHYKGNWKCRTHQCEEIFKGSIIGFIRGCLSSQAGWSKQGDSTVSFQDAIDYGTKLLKSNNIDTIQKINKSESEKLNFVQVIKNIQNQNNSNESLPKIARSQIIKTLNIPSPYFLNRGFSKEILTKYDVGDCTSKTKEMFSRAVVPVYDLKHEYMVGCSGRSFYKSCNLCKGYHDSSEQCPENNYLWQYSKWKHNKGFKTQEHLYNLWYAKPYIEKLKSIILVESPGNVWRLEEAGIHNSVALFGSVLQDKQKLLLDLSGAMTIYILMDNDEAGKRASEKIYNKCYKTYNISNIDIDHNDVAEMSIDQVIEIVSPQIRDKY